MKKRIFWDSRNVVLSCVLRVYSDYLLKEDLDYQFPDFYKDCLHLCRRRILRVQLDMQALSVYTKQVWNQYRIY